jgi:hypothetical protein
LDLTVTSWIQPKDVIHDPTATWGEAHARLIHPKGEQGFTPENLQKLSDVFSNKSGL